MVQKRGDEINHLEASYILSCSTVWNKVFVCQMKQRSLSKMYLESVDKVFVHILDHYRSSAFSGGRSFDGPCRKSFALATEQEEQSLDAALSIDSVKLDLVEGPASMSTSCEPGVQQALEEGLGFSIG